MNSKGTIRWLKIGVAAAALAWCADTATQAAPRDVERKINATVASYDKSSNILKVNAMAGSKKTMLFGVKNSAVIHAADGKAVSAADLKAGDTVEITYRSHLLGLSQATAIQAR